MALNGLPNLGNFDREQALKDTAGVTPGGYIGVIKNLEVSQSQSSSSKFLGVWIDILEGEFKNYYSEQYKQYGNWSYKAIAKVIFTKKDGSEIKFNLEKLVAQVERSNPGFTFNGDYSTLKNKKIGVVFHIHSYNGKSSVQIQELTTVEAIRTDDYQVKNDEEATNNTEKLGGTNSDTFQISDDLQF